MGTRLDQLQYRNDQAPRLKRIRDVQTIAQLTGKDSMNRTDRYDVYGTDLGSMFNVGTHTYIVFGDTFGRRSKHTSGAGGEHWRCNTLAVTTDDDPADGLTFDYWVTDENGRASELLSSAKKDGHEITKIPTHGIHANKAMYLYYMSVKTWGEPGAWHVNYAGMAKSTDGGRRWRLIPTAIWPGESNFIQVCPYRMVNESGRAEIYVWGIPEGRFGSVQLMKVNEADIEHVNRYRYFAGTDHHGRPIWSLDRHDACDVVRDYVGELSVIWNAGLKRWIMMYLREGLGVVMREGLTPWGPWSKQFFVVATQSDYPGLYGPFMNERYIQNEGKSIYFALSRWQPYNVYWMKARIETEGG